MACITLNRDVGWSAGRWLFNHFLENALALADNDSDVISALNQGIALDGLHLGMLELNVRNRIRAVLTRTIDATLAESMSDAEAAWKEGLLTDRQEQYLLGVLELKNLLADNL